MKQPSRSARLAMNRRIMQLIRDELPKLQALEQIRPTNGSKTQTRTIYAPTASEAPEAALPRFAQPSKEQEEELWAIVTMMAERQGGMHLSDYLFVKMFPALGCVSSWKTLKLWAQVKPINVLSWLNRAREAKVDMAALDAATNPLPGEPLSEEALRQLATKLVAKIDRRRMELGLNQNRFIVNYRQFVGSAKTWIRMLRGEWESMNLDKWMLKLRTLDAIIST